ncbi:interleukin-18-like [Vanacampus margaritifer]
MSIMSVNSMSTNGPSPVEFVGVCDGRFHFQALFDVDETDGHVKEDCFRRSCNCLSTSIRNKDNKYLLLGDDSQFKVLNLTKQQQGSPDCKFNFQFYDESGHKVRRGFAVMLYANKNGTKMVVCCNEKREIYPKAMDIPDNIEPSKHEALFYMIPVPGGAKKCMLESSLHPHEVLGFEPEENNPSQLILVLHHAFDEVDECCQITLS